jgi:hypothetical protein
MAGIFGGAVGPVYNHPDHRKREHMSVKRDLQSASAWEAELNKERAGALGMTAQKLEALLERCRELRERLLTAEGPLRELLRRDYSEAREESERQRWNLCVQREAIGLRRHEDVDRFYPVAPKL